MGDRLGFMALLGFAYSKKAQGSPAEIFKVILFTIIPVFLIGPIAGVYVDRWDRRRTMYVSDLSRMLLILILPYFLFYARNLSIAYFIIFLVFCIGRFFLPAKLSIVPDLVDKESLLIANSLVNVTGMIAFILGSGIGGILVEWVGVEKGFYLDALSFFISATLIFFIAKKASTPIKLMRLGEEIVEVVRKSVVREMRDGLLYFLKKKDIRFTAGVLFVISSAFGVIFIVSIAFVQNALHSATKDLGLLIAFIGAGLFLGTLIYGKFGQRFSHYKAIFVSLIFIGVLLIIFAATLSRYPNFFTAALISLVFGLLVSPIMVISNTIIHNTSEDEMRGKIFSSLEVVMHLGFMVFMFVSIILAQEFSNAHIIVGIGLTFSVVGIISLIYHRKMPWLS